MYKVLLFFALTCPFKTVFSQSDSLLQKIMDNNIEQRYGKYQVHPMLYSHTYIYSKYRVNWFGRSILEPVEIRIHQIRIYRAWRTKENYIVCMRSKNGNLNWLLVFDSNFSPLIFVNMEPWVNTMKEISDFIASGKYKVESAEMLTNQHR
jgi:hypothetical protein